MHFLVYYIYCRLLYFTQTVSTLSLFSLEVHKLAQKSKIILTCKNTAEWLCPNWKKPHDYGQEGRGSNSSPGQAWLPLILGQCSKHMLVAPANMSSYCRKVVLYQCEGCGLTQCRTLRDIKYKSLTTAMLFELISHRLRSWLKLVAPSNIDSFINEHNNKVSNAVIPNHTCSSKNEQSTRIKPKLTKSVPLDTFHKPMFWLKLVASANIPFCSNKQSNKVSNAVIPKPTHVQVRWAKYKNQA